MTTVAARQAPAADQPKRPGHCEHASERIEWRVPEPPHPVGQMTTVELIGYQRALDTVARAAPVGHPVQDQLGQQAGQVLAEQDRRAQAARDARADEATRARRRDALHA